MDVTALLQHSQYAVPVGIVLLCAVLVFVFGFKNAEQPPFAQLSAASDVDRKSVGKKRNKTKEKRAANGQVITEKASPVKRLPPAKGEPVKKAAKIDEVDGKLKEQKQEENKPVVAKKEKHVVAVTKPGKENKIEQAKNKKNLKNQNQEKPVDFDDGDWEQAYSRKDKKNKKKDEETPSKKNKKAAKKAELISELAAKDKEHDKPEVKDKVAKETENKELKEKDNKEVVLTPVVDAAPEEPKVPEKKVEQIEKVQKIEKAEDKKKGGKVKKGKKVSESEGTSIPDEPPVPNKVEAVVVVENVEEKKAEPAAEQGKAEKVQDNSSVAFDELGDLWTEAKPQKKSKKKARKDN